MKLQIGSFPIFYLIQVIFSEKLNREFANF